MFRVDDLPVQSRVAAGPRQKSVVRHEDAEEQSSSRRPAPQHDQLRGWFFAGLRDVLELGICLYFYVFMASHFKYFRLPV